jgi:hypothetical protein
MKRLIFLPLILFVFTLNAQLDTVNIGTGPNSRNGDPLRNAFQKVNKVIERMNTISPSVNEIVLPEQVTVPELPQNYTPDTLLVLSNGRIYFTTKDKLNDIIYPVIPPSFTKGSYYVATNGNDDNPGTYSLPFATLQKGMDVLGAGDTLYVRGGTYTPSNSTVEAGWQAMAYASSKSGTAADTIKVWAYPGEIPVFNCVNITGSTYDRAGVMLLASDYWYFKGIVMSYVTQGGTDLRGVGFFDYDGAHNKFENCIAHHNGGPGFQAREGVDGLLYKNCDSHSNYDALTATPGDNADGWDIGFTTGDSHINFLGCRSYDNADDGFDCYMGTVSYTAIIAFDNCWSWHNGYRSDGLTKGGDGCGFKLGYDPSTNTAITRRFVRNCIAYNNRLIGYSQESSGIKKELYNNIAYANRTWGFSFYHLEVPDIVRNNISFANVEGSCEEQHYAGGTARTIDYNSWTTAMEVTVSSADFASTNGGQLAFARTATGALPTITFLHLVTGSDMINVGLDVGLPYLGDAPDLGCFELE